MIVFLTILSLLSGLAYGYFDVESSFITAITQNTNIVLYLLMFSVGISIGMYDGIMQKYANIILRFLLFRSGLSSVLFWEVCFVLSLLKCRQEKRRRSQADWDGTVFQVRRSVKW